MSKQQYHQGASLSVRGDQPLIGVVVEEHGQEVVRYFTEDTAVDASASDQTIQDALSLAGAWGDLDWEDATAELEQIRRQSLPTPPIDTL